MLVVDIDFSFCANKGVYFELFAECNVDAVDDAVGKTRLRKARRRLILMVGLMCLTTTVRCIYSSSSADLLLTFQFTVVISLLC